MRTTTLVSTFALLVSATSLVGSVGCAGRSIDREPASTSRKSSAQTKVAPPSEIAVEADPKWLSAVPTPTFKVSRLTYKGQNLSPYKLHKGEHVFVHSARTLWSPRVSGQAFFDTFLFGCEELPPSPLDRVTNEGHRLHIGESALIEEYPDHVATIGSQPVAWITCVGD